MAKPKPMDVKLTLIILSTLITGALAVWAHLSSKAKDATLNEQTQRIVELQEELKQGQEGLIKYSTGQESFGMVVILKIGNDNGGFNGLFCLVNNSDYPLYDVNLRFINRGQIDFNGLSGRNGEASASDILQWTSIELSTIGAHQTKTFGNIFDLGDGQINDFLFSFNSRDKRFSQILKFFKEDNEVIGATKVTTVPIGQNEPSKVLVHNIDSGFPLSEVGDIGIN